MHETTMYTDSLLLLLAAVCVVATFRFLRMSPVLGYLIAGGLAGPFGLAWVKDVEMITAIGDIGVMFLLFMIGLELSMSRLRAMRTHVFGFGGLQVIITGGLLWLCATGLGLPSNQALIVGAVLALSSTAIVLQVIAEQQAQSSQVGRLSLALLLMQDFTVIPLLVLIPLLANEASDASSIWLALGGSMAKGLGAMLIIILAGRLLLRPLFRLMAATNSSEIFTAFTLTLILGFAIATDWAGMSLALGAFLAGILVAETEYRHQVAADVMPFKGLLLGLFFMAIGMSVDPSLLMSETWTLLGLTAGLLIIKALVILVLCRAFKFKRGISLHASLLLCQGSEFAFVMFALSAELGALPEKLAQILMIVVTLSMAVTPLLANLGKHLSRWMAARKTARFAGLAGEAKDMDHHTIVVGYSKTGYDVSQMLCQEGLPFIAMDLDTKHIVSGRERNHPVYYGDASKRSILKTVGIERADMVVITYSGLKRIEPVIRNVKSMNPNCDIIVRAADTAMRRKLEKLGATHIVGETLEASAYLGDAMLRLKGIGEQEIQRVLRLQLDDDRKESLAPPKLP